MTSKWRWILLQIGQRLWVRVAAFGIVGVATALLGLLLKDVIPGNLSRTLGAGSVDGILQIIASSMLAVTTFSLSTMVSAYTAATSNATPRTTQLLLKDNASQNALAVFIGAFVFSLVGLIALSMGIYGNSGRVVLFLVTLVVVLIIVVVLISWVHYLSRLGRVGQTIDMVERATSAALTARRNEPYLGGTPLAGRPDGTGLVPVEAETIGYVQHVDMGALSKLADHLSLDVHLAVLPGSFNDGAGPIAYVSKEIDAHCCAAIVAAFSIGDSRSFEQDPRFGLIVLSEIAIRALSPAVNDPGTAIDVIGTGVRLLTPWVRPRDERPEPVFPRIHVPPLALRDMVEDLYRPLARDGAGILEVGIRLQKALRALAAHGDAETFTEMQRMSALALRYAQKVLPLHEEHSRLRQEAGSLAADHEEGA